MEYAPPARQPKVLGQKPPSTWCKFNAGVNVVLGFPFLVLGTYAWFALAFGDRPDLWKENLFLALFAGLAGFVFTGRPVYRMIRGGAWWNVE